MSVKLFAIVITYYPDLIELRRNILRYLQDVDLLMIWENTPIKDRDNYRLDVSGLEGKVIFAGTDENMYISYPLNQAVRYAKEHGFTHILTMDQDSCFEENHFRRYKEIVTSYDNLNIWGPNPNNSFQPVQNMPQSRSRLMTSGNIINLNLFDEIGLFREDYKIDCVDFEFCYRAIRNGHCVYSVNSILIHQNFGDRIRTRFKFYTYCYSPIRLYFMARNNIILRYEYPEYGYRGIINYIIKPIPKIILAESNKVRKISFLIKGVCAGIKYILNNR